MDEFYFRDSQFKTMRKKSVAFVFGTNEPENLQYRLIHDHFSCGAEYMDWDLAISLSFALYGLGELMMQYGMLNRLKEDCDTITKHN